MSTDTADRQRDYPDRPIAGVGAVVLAGDQVLMIRRGKPPRHGSWSLPGGAQELGETAQEAVIREVREETGLVISPLGLIDIVDYIERDDAGRVRRHYLLADFVARVSGGTLKAGSDAMEARFVGFDDALALPDWDETVRIMKEARALWRQNGWDDDGQQ